MHVDNSRLVRTLQLKTMHQKPAKTQTLHASGLSTDKSAISHRCICYKFTSAGDQLPDTLSNLPPISAPVCMPYGITAAMHTKLPVAKRMHAW